MQKRRVYAQDPQMGVPQQPANPAQYNNNLPAFQPLQNQPTMTHPQAPVQGSTTPHESSPYMQPIHHPGPQPTTQGVPPQTAPPDGTVSPTAHTQNRNLRRIYPVDEEGNYDHTYEGHQETLATPMANMNISDPNAAYQVQQPHGTPNFGTPQLAQPAGVPKFNFTPQQQFAHQHPIPPAQPQPQQQQQQQHQHQQHQQQHYEYVPPSASNQCPTKFMRFTMNAIPATQALLTKSSVPLGCIIDPLAPQEGEDRIPLVNFGSSGIVRCRRCRAYINPFVAFTDGGRRWRCNLCEIPNEVPAEYYAQIDPSTGLRADIRDRPELQRGCVEFIAPSEYMVRPPQPPVYFFLIDTCYAAVQSGMFNSVVQAIKDSVAELPGDSRTQIGFLTYDRVLHYYNLKSTLSQPQMLVVPDIENVFVPLPDDLLVNLRESQHLVEALLDKLPSMFAHTQQVESAFGPALKAAFSVIKHIGGKLLVFQSSMPQVGNGKLANREDPKLFGTDKESTLITPIEPAATFYKDYALDCSRQQIGIDLFLFPTAFIDVGTLGVLPQITGGQLYYYPGFRAAKDGEAVMSDIRTNLSRYTSWEAVIRVRYSRGLKVIAQHGNFFIRSTDLLAVPTTDEDKAFAFQLGISENLTNTKYSFVQSALLYTTSSGERRIRVLTASLPVISTTSDIFRCADVGGVINLIAKMAIDKLQTAKISDAREAIVNKCIEILAAYRDSFTSATSTTQLALPDTLRSLPLYVLALAKNVLFRPGDVRPDERAFHMYRFKTLGVNKSLTWIYPSLYNLLHLPPNVGHAGPDGGLVLPAALNLSSEKLDRHSPFLLDTAYSLVLFIPKGVAPEVLYAVFGIERFEQIPAGMSSLPSTDNPLNCQIRALLAALRFIHHSPLPMDIIREGDPMEAVFTSALVEDRSRNVTSYNDFITQLQRSVQSKSSK